MNLLDSGMGNKKKTYIITGVCLSIILIIGLVLWLLPEDTKSSQEEDPLSEGETVVESPDGSYVFQNTVEDPVQGSEKVMITVPTVKYGGTIDSYTDKSSFAILGVTVNGSNHKKTFRLTTSGIVFDAKKNKVILPSTLKKGVKAQIMSTGGAQDGEESASVVIANSNPDILYVPVTGVTQKKSEVILTYEATSSEYTITKATEAVNALTGDPYGKRKLKAGDRVFIYTSPAKEEASERGFKRQGVKTIYVYPAPGGE